MTDTRSKTGTYINAEKIDKPRALENGDTIVFGNAVFVFVENTPIEPEQTEQEPAHDENEYAPSEPATYVIDESTGNAYRIDGLITCMIGRGDDVQIRLDRTSQDATPCLSLMTADGASRIWTLNSALCLTANPFDA